MSTNVNPPLPIGQAVLESFEAGEIFVPCSRLTWMDVRGADRHKVLGNLTTNNVAALTEGQGCETFITDARGRTFGHGFVYAMSDRLRIVTVANQFQRLSQHIDRYVVREDIEVEDRTPETVALFWPGVQGCKLAKRLGLCPGNSAKLCLKTIIDHGFTATAYQVPWTRCGDWLIAVPNDQAEAVEAWMIEEDILPGHPSLMHCGRVNNRYPWFGIDFDENNLPQELDRDAAAIDFRKGCYLGQETVARLDAMGQVQKKLRLWKFEGSEVPPHGLQLRSGDKVVATVTTGIYCFDREAPLALAMTRRSHFEPRSAADSDMGPATVVE